MNRKQHKALLIILALLGSLTVTSDLFLLNNVFSLSWFIILYFFAAYIKLYLPQTGNPFKAFFKYAFLIACQISVLVAVILPIIAADIKTAFSRILQNYASVFIFGASLFFFLMFLYLRIENQRIAKIINFVSRYSFGVYLIHDNIYIYVRRLLWDYLNLKQYDGTVWIFILAFTVPFAVFILCAAIDFLRSLLFLSLQKSKALKALLDLITQKLAHGANSAVSRIMR